MSKNTLGEGQGNVATENPVFDLNSLRQSSRSPMVASSKGLQ